VVSGERRALGVHILRRKYWIKTKDIPIAIGSKKTKVKIKIEEFDYLDF
jgi:hypothetical protein